MTHSRKASGRPTVRELSQASGSIERTIVTQAQKLCDMLGYESMNELTMKFDTAYKEIARSL